MKPFLTLHDPRTARRYYEASLWRDETFYGLTERAAAAHPDAPALRDGTRSLSWAQLHAEVDALAAELASQGLRAGDRLCIWMPNRVEAVVAFLACVRQGYACNPSLHRTHTTAEVARLLNVLGASALITQAGWGADANPDSPEDLRAAVPSLKKVYDFASLPATRQAPLPEASANPDNVVYLAFTSGTTGLPKCVMHSANTLLANARDLARDWKLDEADTILTLSPLSHHIAWVAVAQWLVTGALLVTDDPPAGVSRLDWIVGNEATYVLGVPTHAMDLLEEQKRRGMPRIGSVRTFYMAGAPIPPIVAENFTRQGIVPQNVYGMTENSSHQYTHPDDGPEVWIHTCGRGGNAYEIAIFDIGDPDVPAAPGSVGQIGGRGATLMLGYFANQSATEQSFNRDGWFMSGDLGYLDDNGNLRVVGRIKDIIIRGGHNIHPAGIEELALRHPRVSRAAAFGIADERLGERVCLAVSGDVEADDMLRHLASEGLSKFDMPEWFATVDQFPLTPSGKILKRELATMVASGGITPRPVRYDPPKVAAR